jgi:hypothetical protein
MSGEAHGVDAILQGSETLHCCGVKIELEHVVFGYQDVALQLCYIGERGDKILGEHLTTACLVDMLNTFFV